MHGASVARRIGCVPCRGGCSCGSVRRRDVIAPESTTMSLRRRPSRGPCTHARGFIATRESEQGGPARGCVRARPCAGRGRLGTRFKLQENKILFVCRQLL
eukprot:131904-Chlamydomonas_euryale.AAC.2